jgi:hypothetical protein
MEHKMKTLIIALILATTTAATAQDFTILPILPRQMQEISKTVPFNDKDGNQIGTATISDNKIYIRDLKGEPIATIVREGEKKTIYDPNGKILDQIGGSVK